MRAKPVLLLHGGHLGAWIWSDVIEHLQSREIVAAAIDLPSRQPGSSLVDDVGVVREALSSFAEPAVLVGHSYSGATISVASVNNRRVAHLLYVAAALPLEGQSVSSSLRDEAQQEQPVRDDHRDWVTMDPEIARRKVFNDATPAQLERAMPLMSHYSSRVSTEPIRATGLREHPSTYLVCMLDQSFPLEAQRRFASRTDSFIEIAAGHAPMITQPSAIAEAIAITAR